MNGTAKFVLISLAVFYNTLAIVIWATDGYSPRVEILSAIWTAAALIVLSRKP